MASARKIADRVAMLYQGRIICAGPVADIDRSGHDSVDQFIHGRADGTIKLAVLMPCVHGGVAPPLLLPGLPPGTAEMSPHMLGLPRPEPLETLGSPPRIWV